MRIYITDKGTTMDVTLCQWLDGQWSPDLFQDLETNVPRLHPPGDDVDANASMNSTEYAAMIEWWEAEVSDYNARRPSWFTENLSEDEAQAEWDRGAEYSLDTEEV